MTPREQQLTDAIRYIIKSSETGPMFALQYAIEEARSVLSAPPPEEKTCEHNDAGVSSVVCTACCGAKSRETYWQPKPAASAPAQELRCNVCGDRVMPRDFMPGDHCESFGAGRVPTPCPGHYRRVEPTPARRCAMCHMPESSGALYPMGDALWCGTCCAEALRQPHAESILDDRAFLRMLDCAALANPNIRSASDESICEAICNYAEGVMATRKRREKEGGR